MGVLNKACGMRALRAYGVGDLIVLGLIKVPIGAKLRFFAREPTLHGALDFSLRSLTVPYSKFRNVSLKGFVIWPV